MLLKEILDIRGFDLSKTKLVRHPLTNVNASTCYNNGFIYEYTMTQRYDTFSNAEYLIVFIGETPSVTRYIASYKIVSKHKNIVPSTILPSDYPIEYNDDEYVNYYYKLEKCTKLDDLKDRLLIEWGKGHRSWCQNAKTDKKVLMITEEVKKRKAPHFDSFENTKLSFEELEEIINNSYIYHDWGAILRSTYAIYMILDTKTGKKYIGSAYGADGIFGRWRDYVSEPFTGGNIGIEEELSERPEAYKNFEFSIIRTLPKTISPSEVISFENLYKDKFRTCEFGMNKN